MNKAAMLEALRRKKAGGLDISILLSPQGEGAHDEKGQGKDGMAPEATPLEAHASPHDAAMPPQGDAGDPDDPNHPDMQDLKEQIMAQMSPHSLPGKAHARGAKVSPAAGSHGGKATHGKRM